MPDFILLMRLALFASLKLHHQGLAFVKNSGLQRDTNQAEKGSRKASHWKRGGDNFLPKPRARIHDARMIFAQP